MTYLSGVPTQLGCWLSDSSPSRTVCDPQSRLDIQWMRDINSITKYTSVQDVDRSHSIEVC